MPASSGKGAAHKPAVKVQSHTPPTPVDRMKARQIEQADAAVASAEIKVARQEQHVAATEGDKRKRQQEHLKAAKEALAQATAARKELG